MSTIHKNHSPDRLEPNSRVTEIEAQGEPVAFTNTCELESLDFVKPSGELVCAGIWKNQSDGADIPLYLRAQQAVPEGWKLVPVELTEDMHAAAVRAILTCHGNDDFPPKVFNAMLAAAPSSEGGAA